MRTKLCRILFSVNLVFLCKILHDIEERAPGLKRQREDYERVVESHKALEQMLDHERQMNASYKNDTDVGRQRLMTAGRENDRLRKQVISFSRRWRILLGQSVGHCMTYHPFEMVLTQSTLS